MINPIPHFKFSPPKLVSIALCPCIALLLSCHSDKLSSDRAADIIKESYGFPISKMEMFEHGEVQYSRHFGGNSAPEQVYLAEQGLITFEYQGLKKDGFFMYDTYHLALTPRGHDYAMGDTVIADGRRFYFVKAADVRFSQVTAFSLHPGDTSATVEFTWRYTDITPFGIASNIRIRAYNDMCGIVHGGDEYDEEREFAESVVLAKRNDGWRIRQRLALRNGLIRVPEKE